MSETKIKPFRGAGTRKKERKYEQFCFKVSKITKFFINIFITGGKYNT